ncbi:Spermidine/putrescine transport system substrate-binding protein [Hyphomicrobiales bacterium]|nr:Spermidine/putrescine transport system substrate-binding protein [Hyphomicrobiales bacterium]CAH1691353.1 Spermidine/putrescine-binding protein [Hyphomicrobiales bacterium]
MDITRIFEVLLERYNNGGMSRRRFLHNVGTLAFVNGVVGSSVMQMVNPAVAQGAKEVRFDGFGGMTQKAISEKLLRVFQKETGIVVNEGSFGSEQELLAKLAAEGTGDYNFFTAANPSTALLFIERGYTQALDPAKLPGLDNLMKPAVDIYRSLAPEGLLAAVPTNISGVAIAYNHDKVDPAEVEAEGFNILLSKKYPNRISGEDQWQRRICYGALQTGQDINNITDMNAVWGKIAECKRNVFKFWKSNAEHAQLLGSGEAWITDAWYGTIGQLRKAGMPISYYPKQGTFCNFGCFMVIKGTDMDVAYEISSMLLRPEVAIAQSLMTTNVPALNPARVEMPDELKQAVGFDPTGTLEGYRMLEPRYWNKNAADWQREYRRVLSRA